MLTAALAAALAALAAPVAMANLRVVTTDTNLASIARSVGGEKVTVVSLSRGTDDPHHVEPRPSMVVALAKADVFARIGMDLDMWADALLDRCGNRKVQRGGAGYADCSGAVKAKDVPAGRLDPSMGDLHAFGNPHYLLDPANGVTAAAAIVGALIRVDPGNRGAYEAGLRGFRDQIAAGMKRWHERLQSLKGADIVVYHRTWVYLTQRFGFHEYGAIEPKPGVAPSPGQVQSLIARMKRDGVKLLLFEPFRDRRYAAKVAAETGARLAIVPVAVEAEPAATSYIALFDLIVDRLAGTR
jgi:ABC-type Zn uptake system ZnuABC Zn-binding protein ZnuA